MSRATDARGRTGRHRRSVGEPQHRVDAAHCGEADRLRWPRPPHRPHPRQLGQLGLLLVEQVCERPTAAPSRPPSAARCRRSRRGGVRSSYEHRNETALVLADHPGVAVMIVPGSPPCTALPARSGTQRRVWPRPRKGYVTLLQYSKTPHRVSSALLTGNRHASER